MADIEKKQLVIKLCQEMAAVDEARQSLFVIEQERGHNSYIEDMCHREMLKLDEIYDAKDSKLDNHLK